MDTPQLLINLSGKVSDPNSKFVINEEACAVIESLEAPIGVISVAGLYRTGKSFILNQLAGRTKGFDIGASIQPETQGIWMWALDRATLKRRKLPDSMSVILLDTEGLGSFTKTESHDVKIFSLAVLLSSFLVYNSLGTIDDTAVENMSLIVELTKSIRASTDASAAQSLGPAVRPDPAIMRQFYPRFLWLLRDFALELKIEGRAVTEDEYLEQALKPLPGNDKDIVSKNKVRECIRSFFPTRNCYTLKRPVDDEDDLQELGSLAPDKFRKEYLAQVDKLIQFVYANLTPKMLFGTQLNGRVFVSIMRQYVTAINSGSVPAISNAWDAVVAQQSESALANAKATYARTLASSTPHADLAATLAASTRAETAAVSSFLRVAVLHALPPAKLAALLDELRSDAAERLATAVNDVVHQYDAENAVAAAKAVRAVQTAAEGLVARTDVNERVLDELSAAVDEAMGKYLAEARGEEDAKYGALARAAWTPAVLAAGKAVAAGTAGRALKAAEERQKAEMDKARHDYAVVQELYQSVDKEWQKEQSNTKQLRQEANDLRYEIMGHQKTIKSLEDTTAALKDRGALLETQLVETTAILDKERAARTQAETDLIDLSKAHAEAVQERDRLRDQLKTATSEGGAVSAARDELAAELSARQARIDALAQELEEAYAMVELARNPPPPPEPLQVEEPPKEKEPGCKCVIM
ncbi:hypothetical protein AMAG_06530 [Allomyces macrogynus ATCC 38327]|uniref:GB1/RHD3-type G domain-containing protein n=1 Tax=Allomyces macrogynus (strain ATCC 38327) TaxID=578462 RepID=A0A0L0SGT6_ALLM3|nr:hypothetical protein AMAG_06530 [Allomyces macrogynus ATCC 38327]|eukprot:KNE61728.1 hypothetical protein AMAG_06530 [Allomyces macrogynus ATCC 38327]